MGIVKELYRQGGAMAFSRGLGVRILYAVSSLFFRLVTRRIKLIALLSSVDSRKRYQYDGVRITQAMERNLVGSLSLHSLRCPSLSPRISPTSCCFD